MAENDTENKAPETPAAPRPLRFQPIQPRVMPTPAAQAPAPQATPATGAKAPIHIRPAGTMPSPTANPQSTAFVPPPAGAQAPRPMPQTTEMATDTSRLLRRTIRMVPQNKPATPAPAASTPEQGGNAMATDTSRLLRKTIRMTPKPLTATPATPAAANPQAPSPAAPTMKMATPSSEGPHAMQTIKLGGAQASGAPRPTMRLRPMGQGSATAGQPKLKPSSDHPTIRIPSISKGGISLHKGGDSAASSTPTIHLPTKPADSGAAEQSQPSSQRTIRINTPIKPIGPIPAENSAPAPEGTTPPPLTLKPVETPAEPSVAANAPVVVAEPKETDAKKTDVLTLVLGIVAIIAIVLTCVMFFVQYSNFYNGTDIQLPGLSQNSNK